MEPKFSHAHRSRSRKGKPTTFGWLKAIFIPMLVLIGTLLGIVATLMGLMIPLVLRSSEVKADSPAKCEAVHQLEDKLQHLTSRLAAGDTQSQRWQADFGSLRDQVEQLQSQLRAREAQLQQATSHGDALNKRLTTEILEARSEAAGHHAQLLQLKRQIQEKGPALDLLQGLPIDGPGEQKNGSSKSTCAVSPNDRTVNRWSPALTPLMKKSLDAMTWPLLLKGQDFKTERSELITLLRKLSQGCGTPEEVADTHNRLKKAIDNLVEKLRAIDDGDRHLQSFRARTFLGKLVTEVAMVCE